ncbi:MAG: GGDEF domain-containing protein [Eggerthellaceae bacterium]|nr:GGDEF domain-containing protein [Eggerthellaceae bacterium]
MVEPNYESILITNAIGLALLACLLVSSYMTRDRRGLDDRLFTVITLTCAGSCIFEPLSWFADGNPEPWAFFLNYLGNAYCYIASCVTPYLWVLYVDTRLHKGTTRIRNWHPVVGIPVAIVVLLNIGNLFGQYMFTISDVNVYSRLPLSYINYVMMFAQFFYSIWLKHDYQRKHGRVRFFPMAMFLVPIFVGAVVQALMFGVSLAWPCVAIGLVSIHMSLQNELSYIDPLTNLYNRTYLDGTLSVFEREGTKFSGIMIDLDLFKDINDTLGHSVGDEALQQAARLISENVPENALVLRFAGDEFIVLMSGSGEDEAAQTCHAIERAVEQFNATADTPYTLSLSMGVSSFEPGVDTTDDFLRRADERMYEQKREHHEAA